MARDRKKNSSVLFARQTSLTTQNTTIGDFTPIACQWEADHAQEQEDFSDYAAGQVGAYVPPAPGSKSGGTFTMRFPLAALKSGYDPNAEKPGDSGVISPEASLLGCALGSGGSGSVSSAADFANGLHLSRTPNGASEVATGSTSSVINVVTPGAYKNGQLAAFDDSGSPGTPAIGWVKDITGPALTLADAASVTPAAGEDAYGSAVGYLSDLEPVPLTIMRNGSNSAFSIAYIGCVAKSCKITLAAKKTAMVEIVWQFTNRKRSSSTGGLVPPGSFERIRPILGNSGAALKQDGSTKCGLVDLEVALEWDITDIECHSAAQGVSEFVRSLSSCTVTHKIPYDSSDTITDGGGPEETRYAAGTDVRLTLWVGEYAGRIFSMFFPALHVAEPPKQVEIEGLLGTELVMRPSSYSGDTGSTAPADTLVRFGVA